MPGEKPVIPSIAKDYARQARRAFRDRCQDVLLYGSYARGEATADSDVDILVVLKRTESPGLDWDQCIDIAAEIGSRTGELISVSLCSSEDYAHREHPLLMNIRREGVRIR